MDGAVYTKYKVVLFTEGILVLIQNILTPCFDITGDSLQTYMGNSKTSYNLGLTL